MILDTNALSALVDGDAGVGQILRRRARANDAWIAALGLQHRMPVLSRDQHFDAVPELERTGW